MANFRLRKFIKTSLKLFGYELRKLSPVTDFKTLISGYRKSGITIQTVYDIGANNGDWAKYVKTILGSDCQVIMFEPNSVHNQSLEQTGNQFFNVILSDSVKVVDWYCNNSTGDSYYREVGKHYENIKPISLISTTLDGLIQQNSLPLPELIKIDTQGSEIDILKGGIETFINAKIIILEIPILQSNVGAPNFHDYVDFMIGHNFFPIGLIGINTREQIIMQVDLVFINKDLLTKSYLT
jgi:FkbM family methyltransferase